MSILPPPASSPAASASGRGGRVVDGARLESVFTGNRNEGSNPSLSAIPTYRRAKLASAHRVGRGASAVLMNAGLATRASRASPEASGLEAVRWFQLSR
jgi:hypothetical protein